MARHAPVNDVDLEIDLHLELLRHELRAQGVPDDQLEDELRTRFGDADKWKRRLRQAHRRYEMYKTSMQTGALVVTILGVMLWSEYRATQQINDFVAIAHEERESLDEALAYIGAHLIALRQDKLVQDGVPATTPQRLQELTETAVGRKLKISPSACCAAQLVILLYLTGRRSCSRSHTQNFASVT